MRKGSKKVLKEKSQIKNGPPKPRPLGLKHNSTLSKKEEDMPNKKKYGLMVQVSKTALIGLKKDEDFLKFFEDADDLFIIGRFCVQYPSKKDCKEKMNALKNVTFNGQTVMSELQTLQFDVKQKPIQTFTHSLALEVSAEVSAGISIEELKSTIFSGSGGVGRKKRKLPGNKKRIAFLYVDKDTAEADFQKSQDLTINGEKVTVRLQDRSAMLKPGQDKLKKMLQEKIANKLEEKKIELIAIKKNKRKNKNKMVTVE